MWHPPFSAQASSPLKPNLRCYVRNHSSPISMCCLWFELVSCLLHHWTLLPLSILWRAGMMNHPPIPISELAEHTELLKANDNLKLSQEYEVSGPKVQRLKFQLFIDFYLIVFLLEGDAGGPTFPSRKWLPLLLQTSPPTWQCCSWWCSSNYEISVVLSHLFPQIFWQPQPGKARQLSFSVT